jgi:hypothetical protein
MAVYTLILVVLGGAGAAQPLRVAQYQSLTSCETAANEAKRIGFDNGSLGFVCVRINGEPKVEPRQARLK